MSVSTIAVPKEETQDFLPAFGQVYAEAVDFLLPFITYDVCTQIATLDLAMSPDRPFDFEFYLRRSELRYRRLFSKPRRKGASWLEIGSLFPALPIALARLGFAVTVVEEYSFYPDAIRDLYARIEGEFGVRFRDANLSSVTTDLGARFDYITLMGVLEHLPYTPRVLLGNVQRHLEPDGTFFLDVPNIYYGHTVVKFLTGQHIQQPIQTVYDSGIPFVGHHREYSMADLRYVLERAGLIPDVLETFNYSYDLRWRMLRNIKFAFGALLRMRPAYREVLYAECHKQRS
jgi:SAM-dependent methyltransferase